MTKKKPNAMPSAQDTARTTPSLIICRNKHWRFISSFHGPWLQLPHEVLDSLAHQNYMMPLPRLVDPAVFYDVVKIRKAVDEAALESVRASTGVSNNSLGSRLEYLGAGGGTGGQLSKERIFKIRQKAVKLLSQAYALDEVATSVATMQAPSPVEEVGSLVLKRESNQLGAKYVHFFHEKIPSRAMETHSPLDPLNEVISSLPIEEQAPPLRTRALVQILKNQWDGALLDFTAALRITEELERTHKPNRQEIELASRMRAEQEEWHKGHKDWRSIPQLRDEDQPSSLKMQLLFNRANLCLTMACDGVDAALDGLKEYQAAQERAETSAAMEKAQAARLEARKRVKTFSRRALKDFLAFLSHFDYSPGLPLNITNEVIRRVFDVMNGNKSAPPLQRQRLSELNADQQEERLDEGQEDKSHFTSALIDHASALVQRDKQTKPVPSELPGYGAAGFPGAPKIHPASALFCEKPPTDLPPFPNPEMTEAMQNNELFHEAYKSREVVTYHPLITDALHGLLLAHALVQTSPTELLRHAYNVARLARLADGYPIFLAARSPARADWIELLRLANNWVGLAVPWQRLCQPAPLPAWQHDSPASGRDTSATANGAAGSGTKEETSEQKRERIKQESIIDALSDDRVVDEESFQKAVWARERRALEDEQGLSSPLKDKDHHHHHPHHRPRETSSAPHCEAHPHGHAHSLPQRWAQGAENDRSKKEYPITTARAQAIARWVKESPASLGGKKKRSARRKKPHAQHEQLQRSVEANGDLDGDGKDGLDGEDDDGPD